MELGVCTCTASKYRCARAHSLLQKPHFRLNDLLSVLVMVTVPHNQSQNTTAVGTGYKPAESCGE